MSDEFPLKPDNAALMNLARAIFAEGTPGSTSERQAALALRYGESCGFDCSTDTARAGLGAFIDDLLTMDGPRDVESLTLSFQRWYGDDSEAARIADFGCSEDPSDWLHERMTALAAALWDAGSASQQQDRDAAWLLSQPLPQHRHPS